MKYCNWLTIQEGRGEAQRCYSEGTSPSDWRPVHLTSAAWLDGFGYFERQDWVNNYSGFRLPMDDYSAGASPFNEYYKAAAWNGKSNTIYAFGRNNCAGQSANYASSAHPWASFAIRTTPAGYYDGTDHGGAFLTQSNQNHYGIFDLSGNAREWTSDAQTPVNFTQFSTRGGGPKGDQYTIQCTDEYDPMAAACSKECGFRVVSSQP